MNKDFQLEQRASQTAKVIEQPQLFQAIRNWNKQRRRDGATTRSPTACSAQTRRYGRPALFELGCWANLVVALLLFGGCAATTTEVTPVAEAKPGGRGAIVYALPTTALDLEIPFVRVEKTPGKFAQYAAELFGEAATIQSHSLRFAVGIPTAVAHGLPDRTKIFRAEIKGGPFSDSSMTLQFDTNGILTSSVVEGENRTVDFVVSTLEAATRIAGSAVKLAGAGELQPLVEEKFKDKPPGVKEAFERARTAQKFVKDIIRGEVASDIATFQARLAKANEMLAEAMAPFYGKVEKETWSIQFRVVPKIAPYDSIPLFSYVPTDGITSFLVLPRNRRQPQFLAKSKSFDKGTKHPIVAVAVQSSPLVSDQTVRSVLFTQKKRGIHYNIPAPGTVTVLEGKNRLMTMNSSFGQFGSVGFLPVSTGSRKLHQELTLNGTNGGLVRVQNASNAFDPQLVNRTGEAMGKGLDAFDPQVRAEREAAIVKARVEKLEAEKTLADLEEPPSSATND